MPESEPPPRNETTRLLRAWRAGDRDALELLIPRVYEELTRIARGVIASDARSYKLSSNALVHDAYLRLIDAEVDWQSRAHFIAVAARMMRRILIDEAKASQRIKRGGRVSKVPLEETAVEPPSVDMLALAEALERLSNEDPRKAELVDLLFFGGLSQEETAEALNVSLSTIERDLRHAKTWLRQQLQQ